MDEIINFQFTDIFTEVAERKKERQKIHLRVQQRNARQRITVIEGLDEDDLHIKRILRSLKKSFNCNGCLIETDDHGLIIQLSGDQRQRVGSFLIDNKLVERDKIIVHGV